MVPEHLTKKITLKKGAFLEKKYGHSPYMLYLKSGCISVSITLPNGKWIPLRQVSPHSFFSLSTMGPFNENISFLALSPVSILLIPKDIFLDCLQKDNAFFKQYMDFIHDRVQFLLNKVILFSIQSNRQRLSYFFLNEIYKQANDTVFIDMTKTCILECLGMSRGSFYRELNGLIDMGAIQVIDGSTYSCNYEKLQNVFSES